jgi:hypothetical protein
MIGSATTRIALSKQLATRELSAERGTQPLAQLCTGEEGSEHSRFVAHVKGLLEELDQAELDRNIGISALLVMSAFQSSARPSLFIALVWTG